MEDFTTTPSPMAVDFILKTISKMTGCWVFFGVMPYMFELRNIWGSKTIQRWRTQSWLNTPLKRISRHITANSHRFNQTRTSFKWVNSNHFSPQLRDGRKSEVSGKMHSQKLTNKPCFAAQDPPTAFDWMDKRLVQDESSKKISHFKINQVMNYKIKTRLSLSHILYYIKS